MIQQQQLNVRVLPPLNVLAEPHSQLQSPYERVPTIFRHSHEQMSDYRSPGALPIIHEQTAGRLCLQSHHQNGGAAAGHIN